MSRRAWRDVPKRHPCSKCGHIIDCPACEGKYPTERHTLVEQLITATHGRRVAERSLRDLANDRTGDPSLASLLAAKDARIVELEDIVERLNQTIATKGRRAS